LIHQSLVRPETLVDASWVRIGCIHGDLHEILHQGKKHNVSSVSPLIRYRLAGLYHCSNKLRGCAVTTDREMRKVHRPRQGCEVTGRSSRGVDPAEPPLGVLPSPVFPPVGDLPLEQTCNNTLQVMKIDGQLVHPEAVVTFPDFAMIGDRLYRVSCGSQLLVPKSRWEMIFQADHLGCGKTHKWTGMSAKQSIGHPKCPVAAIFIN